MASASVQYGIYYGFTLSEVQAELARYKSEVQKMVGGPRNVLAASYNGKSFSYGPSGSLSLAQWQAEIQDALSQVDDDVVALPSEAKVRFA